jgi:hypothetical protein
MKEKYFRRCARFMQKGEMFCVNPRTHAGVITMDPWPKLVFLAADGEHTIEQLIASLSASYESGAPPGLGDQVIAIVNTLVKEGIVELADASSPLPYYLKISITEQDPEKAKELMIRDGYIKRAQK